MNYSVDWDGPGERDREPETETMDRLYLEWSQFTKARTGREIGLQKALAEIANSNPNHFTEPCEHANWCLDRARLALNVNLP